MMTRRREEIEGAQAQGMESAVARAGETDATVRAEADAMSATGMADVSAATGKGAASVAAGGLGEAGAIDAATATGEGAAGAEAAIEGAHSSAMVSAVACSGIEGCNSSELTQKQIQARIRLKQQVEKLRRENDAAKGSSLEGGSELPGVVYFPEDAPDGPPWRYDLTPEELAERSIKKARRSEKRQRIKDSALDKTPERLKSPSDLQVRFRTAVVYTLLTVACVMAGNIPTLIYLMVVAGICAGEFFYMLRSDAKLPNEALGVTGAVLYMPAVFFWGANGAIVVAAVLMVALIVWYVFWLKSRVQDVAISFFGAAYSGLLLSGLLVIRQSVEFPWAGLVLFLIFLSVWANDAFAYLVGSKIGKHKLAPRTSPKKSWEGFIAGLVGSVLVWTVISFVPGVTMPVWVAVIIGVSCGLAEVLGDLAESRIKRNSGFKDSGTIMPGHGGLLDRCDSLFLASPVACALMIAFGCI